MFIKKTYNSAIGWIVSPCFNITLHVRDLDTLKNIQKFFNGVGKIYIKDKSVHYQVRSKNDLHLIIDHFIKYPLHTSKFINFTIFVKIFDLIDKKIHTKITGFLEIAALANKLNKPLSTVLLTDLLK
jgi:hypothetical protein